MSPLAMLCVRHGLQPGSRCERCYAESEQRRRQRPAHKAHHTPRHALCAARCSPGTVTSVWIVEAVRTSRSIT
jgi:hypothetical protein